MIVRAHARIAGEPRPRVATREKQSDQVCLYSICNIASLSGSLAFSFFFNCKHRNQGKTG